MIVDLLNCVFSSIRLFYLQRRQYFITEDQYGHTNRQLWNTHIFILSALDSITNFESPQQYIIERVEGRLLSQRSNLLLAARRK